MQLVGCPEQQIANTGGYAPCINCRWDLESRACAPVAFAHLWMSSSWSQCSTSQHGPSLAVSTVRGIPRRYDKSYRDHLHLNLSEKMLFWDFPWSFLWKRGSMGQMCEAVPGALGNKAEVTHFCTEPTKFIREPTVYILACTAKVP